MSKETSKWLNTMTLIGMTDKRGNAWHYREADQGGEPNHYPGPIPIEDIYRRLFNFEAVEVPLYVPDGSGGFVQVPDRKAIATSDTHEVMGIFKGGYEIKQFQDWCLREVEPLLGTSDLVLGSAGLLKNRGQAWVQVELQETMNVQGFEYRPYLLSTTSHDGTLANTRAIGAQVSVCDNSVALAISSAVNKWKQRHTKSSADTTDSAREALNIVTEAAELYEQQITKLLDIEVSEDQFTKILDSLVPMPEDEGRGKTMADNKRLRIMGLYNHDDRVKPWAGTAFGVVQAFNTWQHHYSIVRKGASQGMRNMENAVNGKTAALDESVTKTVLELVGVTV